MKRRVNPALIRLWNKLVKKFWRLYGQVFGRNGDVPEWKLHLIWQRLINLAKRILRLQSRLGVKIAGTALGLMLTVSLKAQVFSYQSLVRDFTLRPFNLQTFVSPTVGDIDNDGFPELLVGVKQSNGPAELYFYKALSDSSFILDESRSVSLDSLGFDEPIIYPTLADIDDDGDLDLIVGAADEAHGTEPFKIAYFLNDGQGNFSWGDTLMTVPRSGSSWIVPAMADIDGDGDVDLFIGEHGMVKKFINDGTNHFSDAGSIIQASYYYYCQPAVADLDGDGDFDLLIGYVYYYYYDTQVFKSINDGQGNFSSPQKITDLADGIVSVFSPYDLDSDGDWDLVAGEAVKLDWNAQVGAIKVYKNDGNEHFGTGQILKAKGNYLKGNFPTVGDLSGDSIPDLVVRTNSSVEVFFADSLKRFNLVSTIDQKSKFPILSQKIYDWDNDGLNDLLIALGDSIVVMKNNGDTTFSFLGNLITDQGNYVKGAWVTVGDLNGDGTAELYVDSAFLKIKIYKILQDKTLKLLGNLQIASQELDSIYLRCLDAADLTGDGRDELAILSYKYGPMVLEAADDSLNFTNLGPLMINIAFYDPLGFGFAQFDGYSGPEMFLGNEDGYVVLFQYIDTVPPVVQCAGDTTVEAGPDGVYLVVGNQFDPQISDNWDEIDSVYNSFTLSSSLDGAQLPVGVDTVYWYALDRDGNMDSCMMVVTVNEYTGLDKDGGLVVYPNPSKGTVIINAIAGDRIELIDLQGNRILRRKLQDNVISLDLSRLPSGVYLLRIYTSKGVLQKKLILLTQ